MIKLLSSSNKLMMNNIDTATNLDKNSTFVSQLTVLYLSVHTGAASLICAEVLRQENFAGRIIMATKDELLPYDKTRLSKVLQSK